MARFKKSPINVNSGKISYGNNIVDDIVLLAVKEIPNVELLCSNKNDKICNNAIKVYLEKDGVHIDVKVKIHFTQSVSDTSFKIQESIRHNVEAMTEYHIASVNVSICGVNFEEKLEEKNVPQLEKQEGNL